MEREKNELEERFNALNEEFERYKVLNQQEKEMLASQLGLSRGKVK